MVEIRRTQEAQLIDALNRRIMILELQVVEDRTAQADRAVDAVSVQSDTGIGVEGLFNRLCSGDLFNRVARMRNGRLTLGLRLLLRFQSRFFLRLQDERLVAKDENQHQHDCDDEIALVLRVHTLVHVVIIRRYSVITKKGQAGPGPPFKAARRLISALSISSSKRCQPISAVSMRAMKT